MDTAHSSQGGGARGHPTTKAPRPLAGGSEQGCAPNLGASPLADRMRSHTSPQQSTNRPEESSHEER
eukprot:scaffold29179_cov90-Isochrysis_galbana.AAC.2